MFSRMLRVKNDWRNRLSHNQLSATLMICEEGLDVENFDSDVAISEWYNAKGRRVHRVLTSTQRREKDCQTDLVL